MKQFQPKHLGDAGVVGNKDCNGVTQPYISQCNGVWPPGIAGINCCAVQCNTCA